MSFGRGRTSVQLLHSVVVGILLSVSIPAVAATWYVDGLTGDDDLNDGQTPATAFKTIAKAILDSALTGEVIKVAAWPGNAYAPVVVQNVPAGKQVTIEGAGPDETRIAGSGSGNCVDVQNGGWATISGVTITNCENGAYVAENGYLTIDNSVIAGNSLDGVGANNLGGWTLNLTNDTVAANGRHGIYLRKAYGHPGVSANFANNLVVSNGQYGIYSNAENLTSIILNDSYSMYWNNSLGSTSLTRTNRSESHNDYVGPAGFVAEETGNYHLAATSLAIDAGRPSPGDVDPDGTRNNMGAWGGPGAVGFWDDPVGGPVILSLTVGPVSVPQGGTLSVNAIAQVSAP